MSYSEIVEKLAAFLWLLHFLALLGVLWYAKKDKAFSSTLVTVLIGVVVGGVMTAYTPDLKAFIRANKPPDGDVVLFNIGLFSWYIGFSVFYIIATIATWKIHVWYRIEYSFVTYAHLLAYLLLNLLQVIRYTERLTFNQDYLKAFYKSGVLSINIGVTLTTLVVLLGVAVSRYRKKRGKRGLSWSL